MHVRLPLIICYVYLVQEDRSFLGGIVGMAFHSWALPCALFHTLYSCNLTVQQFWPFLVIGICIYPILHVFEDQEDSSLLSVSGSLAQFMSFHSRDEFVRTPSVRSLQQWQDFRTIQSPTGSNTTVDTVHRTYKRQLTPTSVRSLGSVSSSPLRVRSENFSPARILSRDTFHSVDDASLRPSPVRSSKHSSYRSCWGNDIPTPPRCRTASTLIRESGPLEDIDLNSPRDLDRQENDSDKENQEPMVREPRLSFEVCQEEVLSINEAFGTSDQVPSDQVPSNTPAATSPTPRTSRSFKRWISNLRPESTKHKKALTTSLKRWSLEESPKGQNVTGLGKIKDRRGAHKKSHSGSSAGLAGAVKAVAMVRPTSTPVSRKSRRSNLFTRSNRSSRLSEDQVRLSTDRPQDSLNASEEAALARSVQRQKTMEELLESEASYVADLKVLIHVCGQARHRLIDHLLTHIRPISPC